LHGKLARLGTFEDAIHVISGAFVQLDWVWPVRGEATIRREVTERINVWQAVAPSAHIPLFVVGYTGWKTIEAVQQNLTGAPNIAGVLVIDTGIFVGAGPFHGTILNGEFQPTSRSTMRATSCGCH
jgi:hypothetical protein